MMNTAFRRETVNAVYLALQTAKVADLVTLINEIPIQGVSVTMPHKQAILPYLEHMDPLSKKIGACNTLLRVASGDHAGKLYGFNTDVAGVVRPLERRIALKGASILILGAGGAARAAVYGLAEKGAKVFLWSRKEATACELAASAGATCISRQEIRATHFDVLINATPCGMTGNHHPLPLEPEEWNARLVFDLVYNPLETPLLQEARARGIPTIQGVEMFVHQGARQFELWTGKPAPEADMLRIVHFALSKPH
jgi:3-dehydroquinate dehydratase/shikimate dehydrogenase